MKTSNKILISLLVTIFISISAIFIDVRVFGEHKSNKSIVKNVENYPLDNFRHIIVEDHTVSKISPSISIVSSDENFIKIENYADTMIYSFEHRIVNDTLVISSKVEVPFMHAFTVYSNSNIESISTKGAKIRLNAIKQQSIALYLQGGEINCWGKDEKNFSHFQAATIHQVNSKINFRNAGIDTMHLTMEKSTAGFSNDINFLEVSMKDNSRLNLQNTSELILKKDIDSRVYMR